MRLTILILLLLLIFYNLSLAQTYKTVCFKNVCVKAEIADTEAERARGLMLRDSLQEMQAMLFIFPAEDYHSFWMKNTLIALDIIWLDSDSRIVYIKKGAPACKDVYCQSYTPDAKAKYVLEVNSGFIDKYRIKTGDTVKIKQ
jgi:hypothetical protein